MKGFVADVKHVIRLFSPVTVKYSAFSFLS